MAYSYAHEIDSYHRDRRPDGEEKDIRESRKNDIPEYLDLGFDFLNEYDRAGNYQPNEQQDDLNVGRSQNIYNRNILRASRRPLEDTRAQHLGKSRKKYGTIDSKISQTGSSIGYKGINRKRKQPFHGRKGNTNLRSTETDDLRPIERSPYINLKETQIENPYGWKALGATRLPSRQKFDDQGTERTHVRPDTIGGTNKNTSYERDVLGKDITTSVYTSENYGRDTRGHGLRDTLHATQQENTYGWKALDATSRPQGNEDFRRTADKGSDHTDRHRAISESQVENPYGWRALGPTVRTQVVATDDRNHDGQDRLRETIQPRDISESTRENPYGHNVLGPTIRNQPLVVEAEVYPQRNTKIDERTAFGTGLADTVNENPYGWRVLGATRPPERSGLRGPGKRTFRESFAKGVSRKDGHHLSRSNSIGTSSGEPEAPTNRRRILHAKRLSALPEERSSGRNIRDNDNTNEIYPDYSKNGDLQRSRVEDRMRATDGGDLRDTRTYDYTYAKEIVRENKYAKNITREKVPETVILKPVNLIRPERRLTRTLIHPRRPVEPSTQWTDIATDQNLMGRWHSMFAKIKTKWSVDYKNPSFMSGMSDTTSFGRVEYSRRLRKQREVYRRVKILVIVTIVSVALLVAIIVPSVVFTT